MTDQVTRTLSLRTAVNNCEFGANHGGPGSLGALIDQLHDARTTVGTRRATHEGMIIEGRNVKKRGNKHLIHLVGYTPDDQISVVPEAENAPAADLRLINPPENAEFLDGELMVLVVDDNVAVCRSGLSEKALVSYVYNLAAREGYEGQDSFFELFKRVDIDKAQMIAREGIKSITMKSLANQQSLEYDKRTTVRQRFLGGVRDELTALLGQEPNIPDDVENLKVELLFSFDKRRGTEVDQRQIAAVAQSVLESEDEEGFRIETLQGNKFSANDVVLSKPLKLTAYGKSVHFQDAWGALDTFYDELANAGATG